MCARATGTPSVPGHHKDSGVPAFSAGCTTYLRGVYFLTLKYCDREKDAPSLACLGRTRCKCRGSLHATLTTMRKMAPKSAAIMTPMMALFVSARRPMTVRTRRPRARWSSTSCRCERTLYMVSRWECRDPRMPCERPTRRQRRSPSPSTSGIGVRRGCSPPQAPRPAAAAAFPP